MKHLLTILALSAAAVIGLVGCDDTSDIGNSLADEDLTVVVDSNFTITATTVDNPVVQSRSMSMLLGSIDVPGYGRIQSDFVCQMMPSLALDTAGLTAADIDSVKLYMQMAAGNFTGDSLAPMGLEVYRLTKSLPYPIYSNFDPKAEGCYDPVPIASAVYTASLQNEPDTVQARGIVVVDMPLPRKLGQDLFQAYVDDPTSFSDPTRFARDVFKGFYVRSSYGSGRITDFGATSIRLYYHRVAWNADSARYDTTRYAGDNFAAAPEVVVNSNIDYKRAQALTDMIAAGDQVLAAPAGTEMDIRFPAPEILASYNKYADQTRILNTLTFTLPADSIANDFQVGPPPYILMVLKKDKDTFFAQNDITDNVTSFYAAYDATRSCYSFTGMRSYLLDLLGKDEVTPEDYTFTICPVQVNLEASANSNYYYGTSYVVSGIVPYISKPVMARVRPRDAKIKLTFSAQNTKIL